jgi:hypothetical protein
LILSIAGIYAAGTLARVLFSMRRWFFVIRLAADRLFVAGCLAQGTHNA